MEQATCLPAAGRESMLPRDQGYLGWISKWTTGPGKETLGERATRVESPVRHEKWLAGKYMTYSEG